MDVPLVISHRTAWLFYHAPFRQKALAAATSYRINELRLPARKVGERVKRFLSACGIPDCELESIDILVSMDFMRTDSGPFRPHTFGALVKGSDLHELVPGLCVVREELCFMQAATWMQRLELIEYGYELCGLYELSIQGDEESCHKNDPLTTRDAVLSYISDHPGSRGAKRAKSVLTRVRDRSRSPMETAAAIAIILGRREGGLGYRGIELNAPVEVPREIRMITTSSYLEIDIYAPRANTGIEYDGEVHADASQRARDAERLSVLRAMGIDVHVVTLKQFSEQLAFHRAMNAIARSLGIKLDPTPEFQRAQNELRGFLIRKWSSQAR